MSPPNGWQDRPAFLQDLSRDIDTILGTPASEELYDQEALNREFIESGWARYWPMDLLFLLTLGLVNRIVGRDFFDEVTLAETIWSARPTAEDDETRLTMRRFAEAAGVEEPSTRLDLLNLAFHYGLFVRADDGRRLVAQPLPPVAGSGVVGDGAETVGQQEDTTEAPLAPVTELFRTRARDQLVTTFRAITRPVGRPDRSGSATADR